MSKTEIVVGGTNWSHLLTAEQSEHLDRLAIRVANFATGALMHEIEAGKALIEARSMFAADQDFGRWRSETLPDMDRKYALRLMQVAEQYGDKPLVLQAVSFSVARRLAAPSTPQVVRDEVEAGLQVGATFTEAKVKEMIQAERRRTEEEEGKVEVAEAEAERQRAKADTLLDGQRDLIAKAKEEARAEAEAKVAADLAEAKRIADDAKKALDREREALSEVTKKAEDAALAKAQAEAANLAKAEIAKLDDEARKAKMRKEEAERGVNRLKEQAEFLGNRVEELKSYIQATESEQDEAAEIDRAMKKVVQSVSDAMTVLQCLRHEHSFEVSRRVEQAVDMFSRSAEALQSRVVDGILIPDAEYLAS